MNRDENVYETPDIFLPERFLTDDEKVHNPSFTRGGTHAFGFGRRTCAGINVATNSLFIVIANLLWAFDITPSAEVPSPDDVIDTGVVV